jgi:uncharacterized protein (DUF1501 family)
MKSNYSKKSNSGESNSASKHSRRDSVKAGVLGLTGLTLSQFLRAAGADDKSKAKRKKAKADSVLFINLAGGPAHLDSLDMKPDGPSETKGEFKPIQSKLADLVVCEHMPKYAEMADQFALIRGISHTSGSHPQGQSYISTGNRPNPAVTYPSLGSIVAKEIPGHKDLPPYIAIPQSEWNAGYMGDAFAPFKTNAVPRPGKPFSVRGISLAEGVSIEKVGRREQLLKDLDQTFREADTDSQLLEALDTFSEQAYSMITSKRTQQAFDVAKEPDSITKQFQSDELGQSLLLATRLIEFGIPFVTVTNQGWDTHLDNFKGHQRLLPPFDAGLAAVTTALKEKGLLERTLVVAMGEFGRTPKINQNVGRDHYPRVNWCVMRGAGVKEGHLIGGTDKGGESPTVDTQISPDDIGATILHSLGIDHHTEYYTQTGRPVSLIPDGKVIDELF